ncbi:hypothetical protein VTI28DRAFT_7576 [Corynascus sepedonium]
MVCARQASRTDAILENGSRLHADRIEEIFGLAFCFTGSTRCADLGKCARYSLGVPTSVTGLRYGIQCSIVPRFGPHSESHENPTTAEEAIGRVDDAFDAPHQRSGCLLTVSLLF